MILLRRWLVLGSLWCASTGLFALDQSTLREAHQLITNNQFESALETLGVPVSSTELATLVLELNDAPEQRIERLQRRLETYRIAAEYRAHAYVRLARYTEAITSLERVLVVAPERVDAVETIIHCYVQENDWAAVQRSCARIMHTPQLDVMILLTAFTAAQELNDTPSMLNVADTALLRFPDDVRVRKVYAQAQLAAGNLIQAEAAALDLTRREPHSLDWWQLLASVRHHSGNLSGARQALLVATSLAPDNHTIALDYLSTLLEGDHNQAAFQHAQQVVTLDDADTSSYLLAVAAAYRVGDYGSAANWLAGSGLAEDDQRLHRWRLQLATATADHASAVAALNALIAAGNTDPRIRFQAAHFAQLAGDAIAAEGHLRAVLADGGDDTHTHLARLHLARLLIERGRLNEAATFLDLARRAHPDDPAVQFLDDARQRAAIDAAR